MHIKALLSRRFSGKILNIVIPRRSFAYEQILRDEGVWHAVRQTITAINQGFIPLANDVMSLELDSILREARTESDNTSVFVASRSLVDLQNLSGRFPHIRSKGVLSKEILDGFIRILREKGDDEDDAVPIEGDDMEPEPLRLANEKGGPFDLGGATHHIHLPQPVAPVVDTLVLLDREIDMVTPLCTPLTYEALLDEFFGINNGVMIVDGRILNFEEGKDAAKVTIDLRHDELFQSIRDLHVGHIMDALNKNARMQKEIEEQARRERDVDVMLRVVKQLPKIQSAKRELEVHIALGRYIHGLLTDRRSHLRRLAERAAIEGDSRALLECVFGFFAASVTCACQN